VKERREIGQAIRAAEAAAAEVGPRDPARAVTQTADRVRDTLAAFS
jgi:hypothetical protein